MDDIQIILYIIFVAIAILTRVFKSKKKEQPQPQQQSEAEEYETSSPKPKSFEDLLKEFTGESTAVETEVSSYEEEYEADDEIETYENVDSNPKELKTIDELVDLEDDRHTGNFKHFAGYEEQEENVNNEFVEALQDEEGARKAIIFSEIINRKY